MDAITHLLTGYLLGRGLAPADPALVALTTLFSVLPDFDTVTWLRPIRGLRHRGVTHSLAFGAGASVVGATVMAMAGWAPFLPALGCALLGFLTHVTLDVLNWGCELLLPWRPGRVHFTIQGGLHATAVASFLGLVAITSVHRFAPDAVGVTELAIGLACVLYVGVRLTAKALTLRAHGRGTHVFPTANPFAWVVVPAGEPRQRGRGTVHRLRVRPRLRA